MVVGGSVPSYLLYLPNPKSKIDRYINHTLDFLPPPNPFFNAPSSCLVATWCCCGALGKETSTQRTNCIFSPVDASSQEILLVTDDWPPLSAEQYSDLPLRV